MNGDDLFQTDTAIVKLHNPKQQLPTNVLHVDRHELLAEIGELKCGPKCRNNECLGQLAASAKLIRLLNCQCFVPGRKQDRSRGRAGGIAFVWRTCRVALGGIVVLSVDRLGIKAWHSAQVAQPIASRQRDAGIVLISRVGAFEAHLGQIVRQHLGRELLGLTKPCTCLAEIGIVRLGLFDGRIEGQDGWAGAWRQCP